MPPSISGVQQIESDDDSESSSSMVRPSTSTPPISKTLREKQKITDEKMKKQCKKCLKYISIKYRKTHARIHLSNERSIHRFFCKKCQFGSYTAQRVLLHGIKTHKSGNCAVDRKQSCEKLVQEMMGECFGFSAMKAARLELKKKLAEFQKMKKKKKKCDRQDACDNCGFSIETPIENSGTKLPLLDSKKVASSNVPLMEWDLETIKLYSTIKRESVEDIEILPEPEASTTIMETNIVDHTIQLDWKVEEVAEHARMVATGLNYPQDCVQEMIECLTENGMSGLGLSFEDENLTWFFENCKVVYGIQHPLRHVLTIMKFQELNNGSVNKLD